MPGIVRIMGVAALAFVIVGSTSAQASLLPSLGTARDHDVQALPSLLNASTAAGAFAGNDNTLLDQLNAGLFSAFPSSWALAGKSDDVGNGPFTSNPEVSVGTLILDDPIDGPFVVSLKAGNYYTAYLFNPSFQDVTGFTFSTKGIPFKNNWRDLSHASLFRYGGSLPQVPPQSVPEPTSIAIWTLLGAAFGKRLLRRRRDA